MADMKAKRHQLLQTLKQELSRGFTEKLVEVDGHKYTLRTLTEDDETWADQYARTTSSLALVTSRKAPRLAASIKAIDGISVDQLFTYPDDLSQEDRKTMDDNPISKRYWLYAQTLMFLAEESSRSFVSKLYDEFDKLSMAKEEVAKELPKS